MAKARMLHKKISISSEVNRLSLPARLLFTWMISHGDDEGRLKGDSEYIKATVVPMTRWSAKSISKLLMEIKNQGLIHYWSLENEWFIEFVKWNDFQTIRADRSTPSRLPSYGVGTDNQLTTTSQPDDNQSPPQDKISKDNKIEENKSEGNPQRIGIKNSFKNTGRNTDPHTFVPMTEGQAAALEAWKILEPDNPGSFDFYLWALKQGLTSDKFFQFSAEIHQDPKVRNKGATFNHKVKEFFMVERT